MKTYRNDMTGKQLIITICAIIIVLASLVPPIVNASTSRPERTMQVKSIEIQDGDSLWSIAKQYYTDEYASLSDYIEEIKESNNMSEDTIHTGNYIIIPYYS